MGLLQPWAWEMGVEGEVERSDLHKILREMVG
jgi:hypothetical protein